MLTPTKAITPTPLQTLTSHPLSHEEQAVKDFEDLEMKSVGNHPVK